MTNTIKSKKNKNTIITREKEEVWTIKSTQKHAKFYRWILRNKIMPGDTIPKRILKRYYRRSKE